MTMTPERTMLSPDRLPDPAVFQAAHDDYAVVRRAIAYISEKWRAQPEVEQIAHAAGVTPAACAICSTSGCAFHFSEMYAMARRTTA